MSKKLGQMKITHKIYENKQNSILSWVSDLLCWNVEESLSDKFATGPDWIPNYLLKNVCAIS